MASTDERVSPATITAWPLRAACRDARPGLFYPPIGESHLARPQREEEARQWCMSCPVRAECLDHALATKEDLGVWGGTTATERRDFRATLAAITARPS